MPVAAVRVRGCIEAAASPRSDNVLWMRRHWLHGGATTSPAALARDLRSLGIRRLYPFLGPMDPEGWPGWRDQGRIQRYDPALGAKVVYEGLVAEWTRELARTLPPPEEGGCTWSMGVPAYEDDAPWHRPDVETLAVGIRGVERGRAGRDAVPPTSRG